MNKGRGIVLRATGSWYTVKDSLSGESVECRLRGKVRLKESRSTNPVVVGDDVLYDDEPGEGAITEVLPRRNYIIRRASNLSKESHIIAANIDRAVIVASIVSPVTSTEFIDRFLVTCELYHVPATIILNKTDITPPEAIEEFCAIYRSAGYDVLSVSVKKDGGIDAVRELLRGNTTLIAGNSGVGKSSLVSSIDPQLDIRIGEVSESHHKGKHTTTFSQMYPLADGGYIIDTPGIKGFGLIDTDPEELCRYFPEMLHYAPKCRFYNCTHRHEPDCAIEKAVINGDISVSRYESYLKMVEDDDKYRK